MHDQTSRRGSDASAARPFLADSTTPRAEGGEVSSCVHTHDEQSVARVACRSLRSGESLSLGHVANSNLAMNLRLGRCRKGCANDTNLQVALSCLGILLMLILAVWGDRLAAAAAEALQ